ncbi:MAG: TlpA disulfide reductase family protein [Proteobacteria bacterium]|nr:TlpA disulfide reductase family protein [Pseudomonadota bacterium]
MTRKNLLVGENVMITLRHGLMFVLLVLLSSQTLARGSDLPVRTLSGDSVPLSSYFEPGKWTMVMLWTTYCGTCRSQYPSVSAFHDKHKSSDAKVIGLSLDGYSEIEKVRSYVAEKPMSFVSAVVEVAALQDAYLALTEESFTGTPTYLMFNPDGDLIAHVPGKLRMAEVERFIAENTE